MDDAATEQSRPTREPRKSRQAGEGKGTNELRRAPGDRPDAALPALYSRAVFRALAPPGQREQPVHLHCCKCGLERTDLEFSEQIVATGLAWLLRRRCRGSSSRSATVARSALALTSARNAAARWRTKFRMVASVTKDGGTDNGGALFFRNFQCRLCLPKLLPDAFDFLLLTFTLAWRGHARAFFTRRRGREGVDSPLIFSSPDIPASCRRDGRGSSRRHPPPARVSPPPKI